MKVSKFFYFGALLITSIHGLFQNDRITWQELTKTLQNQTVKDIYIYDYDNSATVYCQGQLTTRHQNLNNTESTSYPNQCFHSYHPYGKTFTLTYSRHHNLEDRVEQYSNNLHLSIPNFVYKMTTMEWILSVGKYILYAIIFINLIVLFSGDGNFAGKITQSPGKLIQAEQLNVTLDNVIGLGETKIEIQQYIDYLKDRNRFTSFGIKIPRGLLFLGPPGCGKTMMAKAVAKTAGVNFIQVTGSDFQEMFVGVGAARVRHLFKMAREQNPCILFIDEIDSLGRKRDLNTHNSEGNSVLNKFLVEMDGFDDNENILVIAATNRKKDLDPALLRSGRFDRKLVFDLPNLKERTQLYAHGLCHKPTDIKLLNPDEVLDQMARRSAGLTGADIKTICNQAGVICLRRGGFKITQEYLYEALEEIVVGNIKRERLMSEEEKKRVAYHEAGHCLLGYILEGVNNPIQVSIIPRGEAALGYAMSQPDDKKLYLKQELYAQIAVLLGGQVAEMTKFGTISTGASDDLEKATTIAYNMATRYGFNHSLIAFSETSSLGSERRFLSDIHREKCYAEINNVLDRMNTLAHDIILDNVDKFTEIAELLLAKEVIGEQEIKDILGDLQDSFPIIL